MSHHYGIADLDEARHYLAHSVPGPRLVKCFDTVLGHGGVSAETILGPVDAGKLRSSATLFAAVDGSPEIFDRILKTFFDAHPCQFTSDQLN